MSASQGNVREDSRGRRFYTYGSKNLPSVTTLLGIVNKPQLVPWSARVSIEAAWDFREELNSLPQSEAISMVREESNKRRASGAELGTMVHHYLEMVVKDEVDIEDCPDQVQNFLTAGMDFLEKLSSKVLATERTVANVKVGYAGTFDALAKMNDGSIAVLDWKSGGVYANHAYQVMAYALADHVWKGGEWVEMDMSKHSDTVGIVQLNKKGEWNYFSWKVEDFDSKKVLNHFSSLHDVWAGEKELDKLSMPVTASGGLK